MSPVGDWVSDCVSATASARRRSGSASDGETQSDATSRARNAATSPRVRAGARDVVTLLHPSGRARLQFPRAVVEGSSLNASQSLFSVTSIACALIAAAILVTYLVLRPPLTGHTKLWLLLGLGVFPIGAAASGNIQGYQTTE